MSADDPTMNGFDHIESLAARLRIDSIIPTTDAGSGHRTSAMSALLKLALNQQGLSYLRTTRGSTPDLYVPGTAISLGGSHLHRSSGNDLVTVVAAGITVFEALDASERMAADSVGVRVLDLYSVSPPDITACPAASRRRKR